MSRSIRLFTVRIGSEIFAVDIMAVRQLVKHENAGELPVIDIRDRFVLRDTNARSIPTFALMMNTDAGVAGIWIDEIVGVVDVSSDELLLPDPIVRGVSAEDLVAMVQRGDDALLILDVDALHSSESETGVSER